MTAASSGSPDWRAARSSSSTCTRNPAQPRYVKTIDNFEKITGGAVGPHGVYALPGRVLIPCLSNAKDKGGRTALVEYSNEGDYIATHWLPTKDDRAGVAGAEFADGYGYDARVLPRKNVLLTTSFTGWNNYTRDFGDLVKDAEAMKQFGGTMVLWDFHTRQPKKVFQRAGRAAGNPLGVGREAQLRLHRHGADLEALALLRGREGRMAGEGSRDRSAAKGGVLPVDISLSADDKTLFVDCFGDGKCRVFDVSNPHQPRQIYEKQIGRQLNMVSQSWDGKRLYFTSSLLAHWDKGGDDNEQFVRAYAWDGKELKPKFDARFHRAQTGPPASHALRLDQDRRRPHHGRVGGLAHSTMNSTWARALALAVVLAPRLGRSMPTIIHLATAITITILLRPAVTACR